MGNSATQLSIPLAVVPVEPHQTPKVFRKDALQDSGSLAYESPGLRAMGTAGFLGDEPMLPRDPQKDPTLGQCLFFPRLEHRFFTRAQGWSFHPTHLTSLSACKVRFQFSIFTASQFLTHRNLFLA